METNLINFINSMIFITLAKITSGPFRSRRDGRFGWLSSLKFCVSGGKNI